MMWGKVIRDMMTLLKSDSALTALLGGQYIYRNKTRINIQIPAVVWSVTSANVTENFAPVNVQLDVWANGAAAGEAIELRLYQLLHSDLPVQFQNILMWSQFTGRYDLHDSAEGVWHSAQDYVFTPARENG